MYWPSGRAIRGCGADAEVLPRIDNSDADLLGKMAQVVPNRPLLNYRQAFGKPGRRGCEIWCQKKVHPVIPGNAARILRKKYSAPRTRLARPQVAVPTAQANDDPVLSVAKIRFT